MLVATELVSPQQAWSAIDTPTLCLLFGPDQAAAHDVPIGWREHARVGVPVTMLTLALAVLWLWLRGLW